jgi:flagellar biosynthesis protein FlhF
MRIKRFEAIDTMTALAKVKEELGEDAIILSTRTIPAGRKNGTGRNGRPVVEMVAAMDYDQELLTVPPPGEDAPMEARSFAALNSYQYRPREVAGKNGATVATRPGRIHPQLEPDKNEGSELRLRLAGYLKRQFDAKTRLEQAGSLRNDPHAETPSGKKKPGPAEVAQWRDRIIDKLQAQPISSGRTGAAPTIVALVGPTGVGKTTTAAKIAAWFSIHEKKRTALISTDCYRIGGTDQLRTYAKIMRLPCEIALGKNDLNLAIRRHQDKDLIIIDTAGKSPYDPNHIRELNEWFSAYEVKTHLVLSATAKKEDLHQIINTYAPLALSGLVLAKLDETRAYASLCQLLAASGLPISCLCTGQRVPEDFLLASKDFMRTLFGKGWQMALKQFQENSTGQWPQ